MHGKRTSTARRAALAAAAALTAGLVTHVPPAVAAPPAPAGEPTGIKTISNGWTIPWGTAWLPDGKSALITERDHFRVWSVSADGATKKQAGTVPESQTTGGEGGLMGIAVDPRWESNHYVYVMHTSSEGNRVARMTYDGNALSGYTVLVKGIKKAKYHNGGRLAFGPDGFLYATTGDAQDRGLAQDKDSLNGKILRLTRDGDPAPGNPFGTLVYSLGHRNPQGIAFDPQGRLWEAELGDATRDELNLIKPGKNYGWPTCEGNWQRVRDDQPQEDLGRRRGLTERRRRRRRRGLHGGPQGRTPVAHPPQQRQRERRLRQGVLRRELRPPAVRDHGARREGALAVHHQRRQQRRQAGRRGQDLPRLHRLTPSGQRTREDGT
ncbi:PQQ-dependent sugar dehydrogenase [Streptomyces sp. PmtG]